MSQKDGTGPIGMGPVTGRRAGFCNGNAMHGHMTRMGGNGMQFGHGRGRGCAMGMGMTRRHGWNVQTTPAALQTFPAQVDELAILKNQAKSFGDALQSINNRITELEKE